jgi:transposase-like protein
MQTLKPLVCPNIQCKVSAPIFKDGHFWRKSDSKKIQRYRCKICHTRFSKARFSMAYRQNKRRVNHPLAMLLASGISLRRVAILLKIDRRTVARKLIFMASVSRLKNQIFLRNLSNSRKFKRIQFDELQTIEHTKCKPLSVALAVCEKRRTILDFSVSSMPATGHLAAISRKKYGIRKDDRIAGLTQLMIKIQPIVISNAHFKSDLHPFYPPIVAQFFPRGSHHAVKGGRSCIAGQGELKKLFYDPLFSLNHTCAMLRANVNRLFRRTWCTTKKVEGLKNHLAIYVWIHNSLLTVHTSTE